MNHAIGQPPGRPAGLLRRAITRVRGFFRAASAATDIPAGSGGYNLPSQAGSPLWISSFHRPMRPCLRGLRVNPRTHAGRLPCPSSHNILVLHSPGEVLNAPSQEVVSVKVLTKTLNIKFVPSVCRIDECKDIRIILDQFPLLPDFIVCRPGTSPGRPGVEFDTVQRPLKCLLKIRDSLHLMPERCGP